MQISRIHNFDEFCDTLSQIGFTTGDAIKERIFSLADYYEAPVEWHTEQADTDPWEWRMRVLNERNDIAYGKLFYKKSGYITKEWYPYFLSARRNGQSFYDAYEGGKISYEAKRLYELLEEYDTLPLHMLKQLGGFTKEEKSAFDRALVELQMNMYATMCGRARKTSVKGEEYGWSSTVFCRTETFFDDPIFQQAGQIARPEAIEIISAQILQIAPGADPKKIKKFIIG